MPKKANKIAFQGHLGAYSHIACTEAFPDHTPLPCHDFAEAFQMAESGKADIAMIPIDNSIAGRVADIHYLLPRSKLSIIGEHFVAVNHCLLGIPKTKTENIKTAISHVHALPQCRHFLKEHKITPRVFGDTAGAAREVARLNNPTIAAIASPLAAELYGLKILKKNVQDEKGNTTRFIALTKKAPEQTRKKDTRYITSLHFTVRHLPAALYKSLGGFSTNGLNILKLESYMGGERFETASFYCEVEGHPDDTEFKHAMDELGFYAEHIRLIGTYPYHKSRG